MCQKQNRHTRHIGQCLSKTKIEHKKRTSSQKEKIVKFEMENNEFIGDMNPENIVNCDIVED